MNKSLFTFVCVLCAVALLLCCCDAWRDREIIVKAEAYLEISINLRTTTKNDTIGQDEILLKGYVIDSASGDSLSGVHVRVVGTDCSEQFATTSADGSYELLLSVAPKRNGEVITMVVELQDERIVQHPLSDFENKCSKEAYNTICELLEADNPEKHLLSDMKILNVGWNRLGCTVELSDFYVSTKK